MSAALVCALLGYLGYEALTARDGVPVFVVETQAPRPAGEQFLVPVTVRNEGRRTAAAVEIEGRFEGGGESVVSTVTLDYVPARGEVDAGLLFPQNPGKGTLTVRVLGYANP
ncbi:hypothetical protein EMQ25_16720 [Arsenicitalea aurantiaca]|uniref:TIGR02588 family protein n=1 Tax=Arsenicitalea aurantiaca TaxID=1783274 RepID=A0A433X3I9_9HYPH|nr:hypothetical protein [Arsenicitalea aurantiaca]RUT28611.1 hypothetical protein EMQ25_16720 [Arsenicitalea aurantiaca]